MGKRKFIDGKHFNYHNIYSSKKDATRRGKSDKRSVGGSYRVIKTKKGYEYWHSTK